MDKFLQGTLSPADTHTFYKLFEQDPLPPALEQLLLESYEYSGGIHAWPEDFRQRLASLATQKILAGPVVHRIHFLRKWRWAVAAAVLLLATGVYLLIPVKRAASTLAKDRQPLHKDIAPGGNKAILTLADGSRITLDSTINGMIARQGNAQVLKLANGQIVYDLKGAAAKGQVMMNTMFTSNGGQYQLILPDGTKVWLNAASSITYPTAFEGTTRNVKVSGEAYFEVAKDKARPFTVDVDGRSFIQVLGTSFNINSYKNEGSIKTTLLDGSIAVALSAGNAPDHAVILKPGQQATINTADIRVSSGADLAQATAWKEGLFNFNGADLKTVMRQLERWYDIRVQYKGPVSNEVFKGKMYRNVNLSDVLEMLKKMGVHFEWEEKNLIVF